MKRSFIVFSVASGIMAATASGGETLVWQDTLDGPYVAVNATLDIHNPHARGEPPWVSDTELNCAGSLPQDWYAGFVSWHGYNARHWGVTQDTVDRTQGTASMRLAYASFGATTADITDIYLGRKFPTVPGQRYVLRFDHQMDRMGEFWDSGDDYQPPRERGWCQYSVVVSGSLANMPSIEDYPPCHYDPITHIWCEGEPGCPCEHPLTRYIFYTDGDWHTYEYEFTATNTETAFVWDFRKNRVYAGDPVISPGDGYHLDNIRLSLIDDTGENLVANGDFAGGLTGWTTWTVGGAPTVDASTGELELSGVGFNGGVYQRVYTGGAGNVVTVNGRWRGLATSADAPRAEVMVVNQDRQPEDGIDEVDGSRDTMLAYRIGTTTGWDGVMPATSDLGTVRYNISFTAAANWATIILRAGNDGSGTSDAFFDDITVRSTPAPATLADLPPGFSKRTMDFPENHLVAMAQNPISRDIYAVKNDGSAPLYRIDPDAETLSPVKIVDMTTLGIEFQSGAEGITFDAAGNIYVVSHEGDIIKGTYNVGTDSFAWSQFLDLPEADVGGWHGVNGVAVDPSGDWLYVCSGTINNETQANWWQATNLEGRVLRCSMNAGLTAAQRLATVETYVQGIRNSFDITFRQDGALFGVDNSPDPNIGCDYADELNRIEAGRHYGWPYRYGSDLSGADDSFQCTVAPGGGEVWGESLANHGPDGRPGAGAPGYQDGGIYYGMHPHSSPDGLSFYETSRMDPAAVKFPMELRGRAFIARWGQSGAPNIGHDVLSVRIDDAANSYVCNTFLSGAGLSNPIDVIAAYNGKLYVLDWGTTPSKLHEISYIPPSAPIILLNRETIDHKVYLTDGLADDTLIVSNNGAGTLDYTITDDAAWLSVVLADGMSTGGPNTHTIEYDVAALPVGTYVANVEVSDETAVNNPQTLVVTVEVRTVGPDLDHDLDVDQTDFGGLQKCYSGSGVPAAAGCEAADFDNDADVDSGDLQIFVECMSGTDIPADKWCDGQFAPDANVTRGGALYDEWWAVTGLPEPVGDHPLWASRPDQASNPRTGAETHRCKECHGWDYKGVDGAYGVGDHRTGIPGTFVTTKTPTELLNLLKNTSAQTPNGHYYGALGLSDADIQDLVKFVQDGQIDTDLYITPGKQILGDAAAGATNYSTTCQFCHLPGGNGGVLPPGHDTLGEIANSNPWELLHKIRHGQPGTSMPSAASNGWNLTDVIDTGAHVQTLPQGQVP